MKSPETIKRDRKMQYTLYRFYWFCRTSWGYQKGQRISALPRFWGAWRNFNSYCAKDLRT